MHNTIRILLTLTAVLAGVFASPQAPAQSVALTFDDVSTLSEYASRGITFTANASLWSIPAPSVTNDPSGGVYSLPTALQFGSAGGVLGSIFFAFEVDAVSIWALSGPGPDALSSPMWIRAFNALGDPIGEDNVNASLQFDLLSIEARGIRRLDVYSPHSNDDVWDQLTFSVVPVSILKLEREGDDMRVTWSTRAGSTNFVQATSGAAGRSFTNDFADLSSGIVVPGTGAVIANFLDVGAATNLPARYYRIRVAP